MLEAGKIYQLKEGKSYLGFDLTEFKVVDSVWVDVVENNLPDYWEWSSKEEEKILVLQTGICKYNITDSDFAVACKVLFLKDKRTRLICNWFCNWSKRDYFAECFEEVVI